MAHSPDPQRESSESAAAARVRGNAVGAAIAAALLIYFGFFQLLEPTGTGLFQRSGWVFYHTLRWGGVAMAILAVASMTGWPRVLLIDGVVSLAIGVLLLITGLLMAISGGWVGQAIVNVFCAVLFISAGLRNGRDYMEFVSSSRRGGWLGAHAARPATIPAPHVASASTTSPADPVPPSRPASRPVPQRAAAPRSRSTPDPVARPSAQPSETPAIVEPATPPTERLAEPGPANESGGFLAGFAEGGPPPRP